MPHSLILISDHDARFAAQGMRQFAIRRAHLETVAALADAVRDAYGPSIRVRWIDPLSPTTLVDLVREARRRNAPIGPLLRLTAPAAVLDGTALVTSRVPDREELLELIGRRLAGEEDADDTDPHAGDMVSRVA